MRACRGTCVRAGICGGGGGNVRRRRTAVGAQRLPTRISADSNTHACTQGGGEGGREGGREGEIGKEGGREK
jgi:hypothetical protein